MKFLIPFILTTLTSIAFGRVGDSASYKVSFDGVEFYAKTKVLSFNAKENMFTVEKVSNRTGRDVTEFEKISLEDMTTNVEKLKKILILCETAEVGGKIESVTVSAGTFNTCAAVDDTGGTINFGPVPFGMVKYANKTLSMELTSFELAP
jgi:hypothetical protein